MADSASDNPQRSGADKERSKQLSRPVSGKEAARTSTARGGRPQAPQRGRGGQAQRPQGGRGAPPRQGGRPGAQRPGQRRPPARRPARGGRSRTNLFIWGAIVLVVVIVGVVVGISQTSSPTTKGLIYPSTPVSATVLHEVTHVPASAYNRVGTGVDITPPVVVGKQKALKVDGKPGMFALLGEYCPFCAAERWVIITSLSRFGTFSGLKTMQSSPIDVYPRTQTFTFKTAKYTSPYLGANLLELYGQDNAKGTHPVLKQPTKAEINLVRKYDKGSTTRSGSIPFLDVGNRVFFIQATYSPALLQGLSRATIAASLKHPNQPISKIILGASNYMSAAVCSVDGGKPGAVCTSGGVKAAAKAMNLTV
jgi:hypothetical protein